MEIRIVTKNIDLTPELRSYVNEKLGNLDKYFFRALPDEIIVEVDLGRPSKHHRKGEVFRCEVNLTVGGRLLRAEERGINLIEAIDKVSNEIERQACKTKEKQRTNFLRGARELTQRLKFFRFRK